MRKEAPLYKYRGILLRLMKKEIINGICYLMRKKVIVPREYMLMSHKSAKRREKEKRCRAALVGAREVI